MLEEKVGWNMDADVIVVGYGSAGVVAGITAHDCGTQVLILEKQEEKSAITSSFMAGGVFICPNDILGQDSIWRNYTG